MLTCRCCGYSYDDSNAFLTHDTCSAMDACVAHFVDTYGDAVSRIATCPVSVEMCKFLTHIDATDPLRVDVIQDVYIPRKHAPLLYDARNSLSLDCADWAALILAVRLYDAAQPNAWKSSKCMRVHMTTRSSSYNKEAWDRVLAAEQTWSSDSEDEWAPQPWSSDSENE